MFGSGIGLCSSVVHKCVGEREVQPQGALPTCGGFISCKFQFADSHSQSWAAAVKTKSFTRKEEIARW